MEHSLCFLFNDNPEQIRDKTPCHIPTRLTHHKIIPF